MSDGIGAVPSWANEYNQKLRGNKDDTNAQSAAAYLSYQQPNSLYANTGVILTEEQRTGSIWT